MMYRLHVIGTALLFAIYFSACGDQKSATNAETPATTIKTLKSTLDREIPDSNETNTTLIINGNSDFAFDLYRKLDQTGENLFFSPYSISSAFTMLYAGAAGNTKTQMKLVMHFLDDDTLHHASFNTLDASIFDGEANLTSANSLWLQHDFSVNTPFLDTLALNYGADIKSIDFSADPESARLAINDWVSDKTRDMISSALPEGTIQTDTKIVLVNTIYFVANWLKTFSQEASTFQSDFTLSDDTNVTVDMMTQADNFSYFKSDTFAAVSLPYDDDKTKMLVVLPDAGAFDAVENNLTSQTLETIQSRLSTYTVTLLMPKFELSAQYSLSDYLKSLGMTDAFNSSADFSGITNSAQLMITDAIHKAVIKVDEEGTEAAAVTAVIFGPTSAPPVSYPSASMLINRPFFFFIMDKTNTILFMGKVENPAS